MRDCPEVWCEAPESICIEIQERSLAKLENFQDQDKVFLSIDLYAQLLQECGSRLRFTASTASTASTSSGPVVINRFVTSAGELQVVRLDVSFKNVCYVGTEFNWEQLKWKHIDKVFEDEVLRS